MDKRSSIEPCGAANGLIKFFVAGVPKPQGSKRAFARNGKPILVESCKTVHDWRADIQWTAISHCAKPIPGAIVVKLTFYFSRPKDHLNSKGLVKPSAPRCKTTKPDLDKLTRAVHDALTGIAYNDDSQIVREENAKMFLRYNQDKPGVVIEIISEV